jgi:hypothetical protein
MNLSEDELTIAYSSVIDVAALLNSDCSLIHKNNNKTGCWSAVVMVRKRADAVEALEIRVACNSPTLNSLTHSIQALGT